MCPPTSSPPSRPRGPHRLAATLRVVRAASPLAGQPAYLAADVTSLPQFPLTMMLRPPEFAARDGIVYFLHDDGNLGF